MERAADDRNRRMPRWTKIVGSVALVLVVLLFGVLAVGGAQDEPAGHGSGDHMASGDGAGHGGNHTGPATGHHDGSGNVSDGPRGPVTWTVEVRDDAFAPADLTIQVGDTIRWVHSGSNAHTVTSDDDGETFDSHPDCNPMVPVVNCMENGDEFEYTFKELGEIQFHCKVHASMAGTVTVLETFNPTPDHHAQ